MRMSFTGPRFQTSASVDQAIHDGVERVRTLPGVALASAACCVPLEGGFGLPFKIVGRPLEDGPFHGGGAWTTVSPGYFEVFTIPCFADERSPIWTRGRRRRSSSSTIDGEAIWKNADPLNEHLVIGRGGMPEFSAEPDRQIIGRPRSACRWSRTRPRRSARRAAPRRRSTIRG